MSEEQLSALLARLKDDAGLQEKLKGAADLDAAVTLAQEAGFDVTKADWLKHHAKQTLGLSDEELEAVAGGRDKWTVDKCPRSNKGCDTVDDGPRICLGSR
jgi:predicted ribosomally synthesized peptide with nif11-like leader